MYIWRSEYYTKLSFKATLYLREPCRVLGVLRENLLIQLTGSLNQEMSDLSSF